jgi:hypothetical protein
MPELGLRNYKSVSTRKFRIKLENDILQSLNKKKIRKLEKTDVKTSDLADWWDKNALLAYKHNPIFQNSFQNFSVKLSTRMVPGTFTSRIKVKKSDIKRQERVDSLDKLMEKCTKVRDGLRSTRVVSSYNIISASVSNLKTSIERCQEKNTEIKSLLKYEKVLKAESKILRQEASYAEKLRKQSKYVWKFPTRSIRKKTERLIADVDNKLINN